MLGRRCAIDHIKIRLTQEKIQNLPLACEILQIRAHDLSEGVSLPPLPPVRLPSCPHYQWGSFARCCYGFLPGSLQVSAQMSPSQ